MLSTASVRAGVAPLASLLVLVVLALAATPALALLPLAAAAPEWTGEFFGKQEGGLFLKMQLKAGKVALGTGNVQVTVWNPLLKKAYLISHQPTGGDGPPQDLRKLPSGKYVIKQIVMVDGAGVTRRWAGDGRKPSFIVKRQCLSNLGLWQVAPDGKDGLSVTFAMAPNSYRETGAKKGSSVAAVLNGFTGLIQEAVGGKQVLKDAESDYSSKTQLRATISFTRQIAMFYKLDLFKHNHHARAIADVLSVYDPNMRKCYTDRLDFNDALRGDVTFTVLLSRQTGTMAKIKRTGGSVTDAKLAECLYYELGQIAFPVPENMLGEVTYTFDVQ